MNDSIFNRDFYPTPVEVIDKMLVGVEIMSKVVLEPSAGSGNIVDYLNSHGASEVIACETVEKLRRTLAGKCNIIADDFLTVTSEQVSHIDLIVMNPPFSADEKHILHAYEIAPGGCEIVALCNSETLNSCYSAGRRKLKELIGDHGFSDDMGECFASAERSTNARISCIHLFKPKSGEEEFDGYFSLAPDEEGQQGEGLQAYNLVRDLVNRYVEAVKRYDGVMGAAEEINQLTEPFKTNGIRFGAQQTSHDNRYATITRDYFKKELQKAAWLLIFDKMNMQKYITTTVREDLIDSSKGSRTSRSPCTTYFGCSKRLFTVRTTG